MNKRKKTNAIPAVLSAAAIVLAVLSALCIILTLPGGETRAEETGPLITGKIELTYDENRLFLSKELTGRDVTRGLKFCGLTYYGYDYENPNPAGWYVDNGQSYSCLVIKSKNPQVTNPVQWERLSYSDEKLSPENEYFIRLEIENAGDAVFDLEHLPTFTLNGKEAEYVVPSGSNDGYIDAFWKLEFNENGNMVLSVNTEFSRYVIQSGTSRQLRAKVEGNAKDVVWSIEEGKPGTTISSDGVLSAAADESSHIVVRCASALYPDMFSLTSVSVISEPVVVKSVKVLPERDVDFIYRNGDIYFDIEIEGTEEWDVIWTVTSTLSSSGSKIEGGWLYIDRDEKAESITIRATSAHDATKFDEYTLSIKEPQKISGTIEITYNEDFAILNSNKTGEEISDKFVDPKLHNIQRLGSSNHADGWYVDSGRPYTCLVKRTTAEAPRNWDNLAYSNDFLDPAAEYYLRFELEDYTNDGYEWDPKNPPKVTVNGKEAEFTEFSGGASGLYDVFVRVFLQEQKSVTLQSIEIVRPPIRTIYFPGDEFYLENAEVIATYSDGRTEDVTNKVTSSPGGSLKIGDNSVVLSYSMGGVTKTVTQEISVVPENEYYILTFDSSGGSYVPAQAVKKGEIPVKPADPVNRNLDFGGWMDWNNWVEIKFDKPLESSLKLTARYYCSAEAYASPEGGGQISAMHSYDYKDSTKYTWQASGYDYCAGFTARAADGYVFKEWRIDGPDGEVVTPDEDNLYFTDSNSPKDLYFREVDGGYKFYAIFVPEDSPTPVAPTENPTTAPTDDNTTAPATDATAAPATDVPATDGPATGDVSTDVPATDGATPAPGTDEPADSATDNVPANVTPAPTDVPDNDKAVKKNNGATIAIIVLSVVAAAAIAAAAVAVTLLLKKKKQ